MTSLKTMLENQRKEKEDLKLDVEARQRVQDVGDQTLDQRGSSSDRQRGFFVFFGCRNLPRSLQQQRSLQTTISSQELSLQRLSLQARGGCTLENCRFVGASAEQLDRIF